MRIEIYFRCGRVHFISPALICVFISNSWNLRITWKHIVERCLVDILLWFQVIAKTQHRLNVREIVGLQTKRSFRAMPTTSRACWFEVFEGEQVMTMVFSFSRGWICTPVSRLKIIYSNIFIELESYLNTYCSRCRKKCKNKYFGIDWKLIPMWHKQEKLFSSFLKNGI